MATISTLGDGMGRDPSGFADGPNLYAYVGNGPTYRSDPYGLEYAELGAVVGAEFGAGVVLVLSIPADFATAGGNLLLTPAEMALGTVLFSGLGYFVGRAVDVAMGTTGSPMIANNSKGNDSKPAKVVTIPTAVAAAPGAPNPLDPNPNDPNKKNTVASKPPLRRAYEEEVGNLAKRLEELKSQGKSWEEIAKELSPIRRELGVKYKDMTPPEILEQIYRINRGRYSGDPLGPTIEFLRSQGKTWEEIARSATRPGPWPPKGG